MSTQNQEPKIQTLKRDGNRWDNAHAVLGRAMERTTPGSKLFVAWFNEETKEIVYLQTGTDLEVHYMCHRIAGGL